MFRQGIAYEGENARGSGEEGGIGNTKVEQDAERGRKGEERVGRGEERKRPQMTRKKLCYRKMEKEWWKEERRISGTENR